jgi:selenocysteine lyase/cysteine desulfurase
VLTEISLRLVPRRNSALCLLGRLAGQASFLGLSARLLSRHRTSIVARRAYLDHASTSPLRPEARAALVDALDHLHGDPGRIHEEGMAARVALEQAREHVASFLGARPREVVFTSGATEAIATAVWGASERGSHQVVPAVEHSAVRASGPSRQSSRGRHRPARGRRC